MMKQNLKLAAIILSIGIGGAGGATTISAQSINDDLKPSPPKTTKTVKTAKPKTVKPTAKPVAKTAVKKSSRQSSGRTASAPPVNNDAAPAAKTEAPKTVYSETPEQIISRFMDFQQTVSVTDKDWQSVMSQTAQTLQDNPQHSTAKAQSLVAQGQIALNQNSYPAAISYFKSALQILPTSSLIQYSLGKVYLANGQAKTAEQFFKEAIDKNEDFALAYKGLGEALTAQGEKKKAVKYFKKATETSVRKNTIP